MNRGPLLVLAVLVAVIAVVSLSSLTPTTSDLPPAPEPEPSPRTGGTEEPEKAPGPPAGGILVLDRHGAPALAYVLTSADRDLNFEDWERLGKTDAAGTLDSSEFRTTPRALVLAGSEAGVGGPVEWDPSGTLIRLGDGCVLTGFLRDPEGNPVPGTAVGAREADSAAFANEAGSYRLAGLLPGRTYRITAGPWRGPRTEGREVTFERLGDEKRLDFEVPAPNGPQLLIRVTFDQPPRAEGRLSFGIGMKEPASLPLPRESCLIRFPGALTLEDEAVEVNATCPGYRGVTKVVSLESAGTSEVSIELVSGGLPRFGRVVDSEGRPVSEAEVRAYESPSLDARQRLTRKTFDDGRFELDSRCVGLHLVAVVERRGISPWLHLAPDTTEVLLVLGEACIVEGRVVDRDSGGPVPGATVKLGFDLYGHNDWTTTSAEDGSYRFAGIPAGSFVWPRVETSRRAEAVESGPDWHDADAKSRTEAVEKGLGRMLERDGDVFRKDLTALRTRGGTARFVLEFPEGAAVPERITVFHESHSAAWHRTSEGARTLDPDLREVEIYMEEGTHHVTFRAGNLSATVSVIEVTGDGDLPLRTVLLGTHARVLARLVDAEGRRVREAGVNVALAESVSRGRGSSGHGIGNADTNEDGEADVSEQLPPVESLDNENVEIRFTLHSDGFFWAWPFGPNANLVVPGPELARRLRSAEEEDVILEVPAYRFLRVPVVVADPEHNPLPGVRLTCSPPEDFEETEVVTDARGTARIGLRFEPKHWGWEAKIEAGAPYVGAIDHDNSDSCRKKTEDGGEYLLLTADRARDVAVLIVDQAGRPIRNTVLWYRRQFPGERLSTDAEGVVALTIPEDEFEIQFDHDDYASDWETVPRGATEHRYTMTRTRPVAVEVVVPADLLAEREFQVEADPRGAGCIVELDEDGHYRGRADVPLGAGVEMHVLSPDRRWEARATIGPGDDSAVLTLSRRKLHPVTLRLLTREDAPLPGVKARAAESFTSTDVRALLTEDLESDVTGRIRVLLPAGEQKVHLHVPGWMQDSVGDEFTVPRDEEVVLRFDRQR